jgi:acetate kinase
MSAAPEGRPAACIAVLNAGSSSIKFALYGADDAETLLFRGQIGKIGLSPHMTVTTAQGEAIADREWPAEGFDHAAATRAIVEVVRELAGERKITAVGHRVVHGGMDFSGPIRIDQEKLEALYRLAPLAPLHQPHNLAPISAIAEAAPHIVQVACFDTAFHRVQPQMAQLFGLPRKYAEEGIRRYGFHGLSYEYVSERLKMLEPTLGRGRVIIAHLGNGASLCAVHSGTSIATTMGFTAVDGLIMGTRCGLLDPGVLIHLMDRYGMDARALEDLIYRQSGLLGISGISSDMQLLRASSDPAAAEAISLFVYRVVREIGSLTAALGGLDALVFTGGIGENDMATRAEVGAGCDWLGVELDTGRNVVSEGCISTAFSHIPVWVIATDEERMVARHTAEVAANGLRQWANR